MGKTFSLQRGGDLIVLRIMPMIDLRWLRLKDRLRLVNGTTPPHGNSFDEPTSALDPEMTAEVLDVIADLKAEGRTFILVTHAMNFARVMADEVAFLADGRIVEHGAAEEFFAAPQTPEAARFLNRVLKY